MNRVFSYLLETMKAASVLWALCSLGGFPKALKAPPGFPLTQQVAGRLSHTVLHIQSMSVGTCKVLRQLSLGCAELGTCFLDFLLMYWYLQ